MDPILPPRFSTAASGLLEKIPAVAKARIIRGIHEFSTAEAMTEALLQSGIRRSPRTMMTWMKAVRKWLGLGELYPSSTAYRDAVLASVLRNGAPTPEEIAGGWQPVVAPGSPPLST